MGCVHHLKTEIPEEAASLTLTSSSLSACTVTLKLVTFSCPNRTHKHYPKANTHCHTLPQQLPSCVASPLLLTKRIPRPNLRRNWGLTSETCRWFSNPPMKNNAADQTQHPAWAAVTNQLVFPPQTDTERESLYGGGGNGGGREGRVATTWSAPSRCPSGSHKGNMEAKATTCPHAWCPLTHALQWILVYGNERNWGFLW